MLFCPSCGARNATSARWCTQCYEPVGEAASDPAATASGPAAAPPRSPETPVTPATEQPASTAEAAAASSATPGSEGTTERDIRQRDGEVEWRCHRCGGWQALTAAACETCGMPRRGFGDEPRPERPRVPPTTAVVATVVLPGAGHLLLGSVGAGLARLALWTVWLVGGIAMWRGPGSPAVAGTLLAGALGLWAVGLVGTLRLARGATDPVTAPMLGVGVVVVTLLAILAGLPVLLA